MGKSEELMEPYYTIMKLPEEKKEEFILNAPLYPKKKDNLSARMVARSDGEHTGSLVVYRFPERQARVRTEADIARNQSGSRQISRQISLWGISAAHRRSRAPCW